MDLMAKGCMPHSLLDCLVEANNRWLLHLLTYLDDILAQGHRADVQLFLEQLSKYFSIKPSNYLSKTETLVHLGMVFVKTDDSTHLSMQSCIEVMCHTLDIAINKYKGK